MVRQLITGAAQSVGKAAKTLVAAAAISERKTPAAQASKSRKTASGAKKASPKRKATPKK